MIKEYENKIEELVDETDENVTGENEFVYNIISYGADFSFREIINMYDEKELIKPELQRKYVWDKVEAGRFIESLLMGLPVPSVFFAIEGSQKLIVDGYQRIMTVRDYLNDDFNHEGSFAIPKSKKINIRWRGKKFKDLTIDEQRKIKSTTIHAIIFQQTKPEKGKDSLYQIFERINTSGRTLVPQEIRNCIFQGEFNRLLFRLNKDKNWRQLFGTDEDNRMRDIELILRFFALKSKFVMNTKLKQISLKKTLNDFMDEMKNITQESADTYATEFKNTMKFIYNNIGLKAFYNYNGNEFSNKINPAIFDSISIAVFNKLKSIKNINCDYCKNHLKLLNDKEYKSAISMRTTDVDNIKIRINAAEKILFS